jgi:shikimate dehydrogenase
MTEFVRFARDAGATALDGLGMLVHQAALSFRLWTGVDPPLDVMAEAARAALSSSEASDPV